METFLLNQKNIKGTLTFNLLTENNSIALTGDNISEQPKLTIPNSPILTLREIDLAFVNNIKEPDLKNTIRELYELINHVVGDKDKTQNTVILLYVLLTYCYALFESLPILWIYTPQYHFKQMLGELFNSLCFNGIEILPYYPDSVILDSIEKHNPTLIVTKMDKLRDKVSEPLFSYPNTSLRKYIYDDESTVSLYSPKIILSDKYPPREITGHAVILPIHGPENPGGNEIPRAIESKILGTVLRISGEINNLIDNYTSQNRINKALIPFYVIADAIKSFFILEEVNIEQALVYVNESFDTSKYSLASYEYLDIIFLLKNFLQLKPSNTYPNKLIPIQEIVDWIKNNNDVFQDINPKGLSQELNKWPSLVLARKRDYFLINNQKRQLTCIELNEKLLNRF